MRSEVFLISLAIFCQCFSYADWYFIKLVFDVVDAKNAHLVIDDFLPYWFLIYFIGKLSGAYFFGKITQTLHYFKVMRLITLFYLAAVFLILIILMSGVDFYSSYKTLYFSCFLTSIPFYSLTVLSAMYLFDRYPSSQHALIASYIVFAIFAARFLFRFFVCCAPYEQIKIMYTFSAMVTCISFFIYAYIEKSSSPVISKPKITQKLPLSFIQKRDCAFIGVGWNVGFSYCYYFLVPYAKYVCIVDNYSIGGFPFPYIAQLLFLLPAGKICEKFGSLKVFTFSIYSMLVLGLLIPFIAVTKISFTLLICLFSFFSACTFVPILTALYQFFKNTKSIFEILLWFAFGSSVASLLFSIVCHFSSSFQFTFAGMFIFVPCILLCLTGVQSNESQKNMDVYTGAEKIT